jgi:hypothetical protein
LVGKVPSDESYSLVKHINGGCWDGTETKPNTNVANKDMIMDDIRNECRLTSPSTDELKLYPYLKNTRPWIVYPGAVQIGTYK